MWKIKNWRCWLWKLNLVFRKQGKKNTLHSAFAIPLDSWGCWKIASILVSLTEKMSGVALHLSDCTQMYYRLSLHGFILDGTCVYFKDCILTQGLLFMKRSWVQWYTCFLFQWRMPRRQVRHLTKSVLKNFLSPREDFPFLTLFRGGMLNPWGQGRDMRMVVVGLSNQRESKGSLGPTWTDLEDKPVCAYLYVQDVLWARKILDALIQH